MQIRKKLTSFHQNAQPPLRIALPRIKLLLPSTIDGSSPSQTYSHCLAGPFLASEILFRAEK
jgi:hypothetical protein